MKIYLSAYSLLWNNHQLRTGSASPLAKEKTFTLPPYSPLPGYQWEPLLSDSLVEDNNSSNSTRLENLFSRVTEELLKISGFNASDPRGCFIFSSTKGNIDLLRGTEPEIDPRCFLGEMAERICRRYDAPRPIVISNACISGSSALIVGARLLQAGLYNHIFVLGGDLLSPFVFEGFKSFKALSTSLCHPFDISHDGLTLGEACAGILLTRRRYPFTKKGDAYFTLLGGAMTDDANHISAPSRTGDGLALAISQALQEACLTPKQIDAINAHGTGTLYNDEMESKAIHCVQMQSTPLNTLKPYLGHTLGAAGIAETILCLEQMRSNSFLGIPGFSQTGVSLPLNLSSATRSIPLRNILKLLSGFGGTNAAIIIHKTEASIETADENLKDSVKPPPIPCSSTERAHYRLCNDQSPSGKTFAEFIREEYKKLNSPNPRFHKMDPLSKLGSVAAEQLLRQAPEIRQKYPPETLGIILVNRSASLDTDLRHQQIIEQNLPTGTSPAVFVYTLPNIVAGEIAIRHQFKGETLFFIQTEKENPFPRKYAELLLLQSNHHAILFGWCELLGEKYDADFYLLEKQSPSSLKKNL